MNFILSKLLGFIKPSKEYFVITVIHVYDGGYFLKMGRMDNVTIIIKGQVQPHHVAAIQSSIVSMYNIRYTIKRLVPDQEVVKMLENYGYEILNKSVVYNIDYTGIDSVGDD